MGQEVGSSVGKEALRNPEPWNYFLYHKPNNPYNLLVKGWKHQRPLCEEVLEHDGITIALSGTRQLKNIYAPYLKRTLPRGMGCSSGFWFELVRLEMAHCGQDLQLVAASLNMPSHHQLRLKAL